MTWRILHPVRSITPVNIQGRVRIQSRLAERKDAKSETIAIESRCINFNVLAVVVLRIPRDQIQ